MLKELGEMSIGQKLYDYKCKSCGFEKGVPEFLIEEFNIIILLNILFFILYLILNMTK